MSGYCHTCGFPNETLGKADCWYCEGKSVFVTFAEYEQAKVIRAQEAVEARVAKRSAQIGCNVIGDAIHGGEMDWTTCERYTSKARRKADYEAADMVMLSPDEFRRKRGGSPMPKPGVAITYPGQKNHKSTAERGGVRTASGARVI